MSVRVRAIVAVSVLALLDVATASGATLSVAPGGTPSGNCQTSACDLAYAVNSAAQPGDEIIVAPGTYTLPAFSGLTLPASVFLHGVAGEQRPVIQAQPDGTPIAITAPSGTVADLEIDQPNANAAALVTGGNGSQLVLTAAGQQSTAVAIYNGGTLSDSLVLSSGPGGQGVEAQGTPLLRNLTAIASGNGGIAVKLTSNSVGGSAYVTVVNTIALGSGGDLVASNPYSTLSQINVSYSDYRPGNSYTLSSGVLDPGAGNIAASPVFAGSTDFHEQASSPTVDAGTSSAGLGPFDLEGNPRTIGAAPDIGAYEYVPSTSTTSPQPSSPGGSPSSLPSTSINTPTGVKLLAKTVNTILPNLTCVDRRKFTFPVTQTKAHNGNVLSAVVYVNGKKTKTVTGKNIRSVSIAKLPEKTFLVKVITITTKHLRITSSRRYVACKRGQRSKLKR